MDALAFQNPAPTTDHPAAEEYFGGAFRAMLGEQPYPWQFRLFQRLVEGQPPEHLAIPSGCGKSAVPVIWILAVGFAALHQKPGPAHRLVILRHTLPQSDSESQVARAALNALVTANLSFGATTPLTPVLQGLQALSPHGRTTPLRLQEHGGQNPPSPEGDDSDRTATIVFFDALPIHMVPNPPLNTLQSLARQIGVPQDGALCLWPQGHLSLATGASAPLADPETSVLGLDAHDRADHRLAQRLRPRRSVVMDPTQEDNSVRTMLGWALQFESQRKWVLICTTDPSKAEAIHKGLSASLPPNRLLRVGSEQRAAECSATFESLWARDLFTEPRSVPAETTYLLCTDEYRWVGDLDVDVGIFDHASECQQAWRASRVNRSARPRDGVVIQLERTEDNAHIHHIASKGQPTTTMLWRSNLPLIQDVPRWLNTFPVQPRERLHTTQSTVHRFLKNYARQRPHEQLLLIPAQGEPAYCSVERLMREPLLMEQATLILPSSAGGLRGGFLAAEAGYPVRDLADVDNIRERWVVYRSGRYWHGRRIQGIDRAQRHTLGAGQPRQALSALERKTGLELVYETLSDAYPRQTIEQGSPEAYQTWLIHPEMEIQAGLDPRSPEAAECDPR
ncbi:hypothetical protein [Ectothiorhodospira variabilis]|uniref:hypothetical protein n=2 Tax=Ectothiorhodospira variabilis TaxID=505694 RepID=UPI001EFB16D7|nr:hypothetical protein [Ectothiorhodospira variabilis]MCG5508433.1 hypothetical protein [Ectothiorhodospira variabilis]